MSYTQRERERGREGESSKSNTFLPTWYIGRIIGYVLHSEISLPIPETKKQNHVTT